MCTPPILDFICVTLTTLNLASLAHFISPEPCYLRKHPINRHKRHPVPHSAQGERMRDWAETRKRRLSMGEALAGSAHLLRLNPGHGESGSGQSSIPAHYVRHNLLTLWTSSKYTLGLRYQLQRTYWSHINVWNLLQHYPVFPLPYLGFEHHHSGQSYSILRICTFHRKKNWSFQQ